MPNTNDDGLHENSNDKHDVLQVRSDSGSAVLVNNGHGSNSVISSDDAKVHGNVHDDQHSVQQIRSDGDHIVLVTNANGTNLIVHSDDGVIHTNSMGDGWLV